MNDLIVQGLSKYYGTVAAVNNVSFTVEAGKLTTLLGPSGCGKTTTLNSIAGLETPDSGLIQIGSIVLTDMSRNHVLPPEQRQLGMVFQSYALWPHMTVRGNLNFGLKMQKVPSYIADKRITDALELVGLSGLEDRYPFQLSGGQQQRVALARAIVTEPRLLLLDEPLSNLDAKVRESARSWLRDFQQRLGITTVYVTHDQSEALSISDMVAVMHNGKLVQYAPPAELYERPTSYFAAEFIGVTAFLDGVVAEQTNDSVKVTLVGGQTICAQTDRVWSKGAAVEVAIRSERIRIVPDKAGNQENTIAATVLSSVYMGSKWQHEVETTAGKLKVETLDVVGDSAVWLQLPADAIILLSKETDSAA